MKYPRKTSDSYQKIWRAVEKIPKGKVATYGQIARISKLPNQARLVGYALHNLPRGIDVPWQRVINSQGRISFSENSSSYKRQRELLNREGIVFLKGRIDLKAFGWKK
jgi:methylated-DNA-protein-cysteine methyltransferase-like protein